MSTPESASPAPRTARTEISANGEPARSDLDPARLARRLERERQRRIEAESIAEDATRHLFESNVDLQMLNDRLDRANDELRSIIYTVSHDLRNPIVTLLGYLELWSSDDAFDFDDEHTRDLEVMLDKSRYMRALTQDLLEVSRIGRADDALEEVDLASIVETVARGIRSERERVGVLVEDLPTLHASPLRMTQVFTNLITNAVNHSGREDVTIVVRGRRADDGGVEIEVSDDGQGIPARARERIFELFHRADHRRDADSTGVGLTICRKIISTMGGSIRVADVERGATFLIHLPSEVVIRRPGNAETSRT